MRFRDIGIRTKAMAGGLIPVLLLVILATVAWKSIRSMSESIETKDHTYRTIQQTEAIEKHAVDLETGLHGYLLTGKEEFLKPYVAAEKTILNEVGELKKQLRKQSQVDLLGQIEAMLKEWKTGVSAPQIALRREVGEAKDMNHMAALIAAGSGKESFDQLRNMLRQFVKNEEAVLAQKLNHQEGSADQTKSENTILLVIDENEVVKDAIRLSSSALDVEVGLRGYLLTGKDAFLEPYRVGREQFFQKADLLRNRVLDNLEQTKLLGQIEDRMKDWLKEVAEPEIALRRQIAESKTMMDVDRAVSQAGGKEIFDKLRELMDEFRTEELKLLELRTRAAQNTEGNAYRVIAGGTALTILATLIILFLLTGAISRPLLAAMRLAEGIQQGDLTRSMKVRSRDEVGRLCTALNGMVDVLRNQTRETLDAVNVLTTSAAEISTTVAQLATSTAKTSSAVTETSVTVEEVKQSARISNEQAKNVSQAAQRVVRVSDDGRKATKDTTNRINLIKEQMESIGETVEKLNESSDQIAEIIASVQDLADQSNLLAVNASIEAARAGDHGKGFAVVAQEIKNLADQSKAATEQVRSILEETRRWVAAVVMATDQGAKAVAAGVEESNEAERAIHVLGGNVAESAHAAQVIEASSDQQLAGVDQVAQAMTSIEQAMQQNVGGTVQLEAAARKLADVGGQLKDLMERYRV
jgi:methyl-accepting chemotaxis protein